MNSQAEVCVLRDTNTEMKACENWIQPTLGREEVKEHFFKEETCKQRSKGRTEIN